MDGAVIGDELESIAGLEDGGGSARDDGEKVDNVGAGSEDDSRGSGCIGLSRTARELRRASVSLIVYGVERLRLSSGISSRKVAFMDEGAP